jgi:hypothetical protein
MKVFCRTLVENLGEAGWFFVEILVKAYWEFLDLRCFLTGLFIWAFDFFKDLFWLRDFGRGYWQFCLDEFSG